MSHPLNNPLTPLSQNGADADETGSRGLIMGVIRKGVQIKFNCLFQTSLSYIDTLPKGLVLHTLKNMEKI